MYAQHLVQRVQRAQVEQRFRARDRVEPHNPGVTTYIDGVPQLHANASNIEFTGVEQVEFVAARRARCLVAMHSAAW